MSLQQQPLDGQPDRGTAAGHEESSREEVQRALDSVLQVVDSKLLSSHQALDVQVCVSEVLNGMSTTDQTPGNLPVVGVLGQNGRGKSFHLNAVLRVSESPAEDYISRNKKIAAASAARGSGGDAADDSATWLLEGERWAAGQHLSEEMSHSGGGEEEKTSDDRGVAPVELVEPPAGEFDGEGRVDSSIREAEREEVAAIVAHCVADRVAPAGPNGRNPFLLPSKNGADTTTHVAIRLRYTRGMYHLVIRYRTEAELRHLIDNFPWEAYRLNSAELTQQQRDYQQYMRELLEAVRVPAPAAPAVAAPTAAATAAVTAAAAAGAAPPQSLAALRQAQWDEEEDEEGEELPDLSPGEQYSIKPQLLQFLGKVLLFKSCGKKLVHDRLYLRNVLERELFHVPQHILIAQVAVFAPCDILRGIELVDTPGTGEAHELRLAELHRTLERADHVLLFLHRVLKANCRDREIVDKMLVPRLMQQEGRRPLKLTVISTNEREELSDITVEGLAAASQLCRGEEAGGASTTSNAITMPQETLKSVRADITSMVKGRFPAPPATASKGERASARKANHARARGVVGGVQFLATYPFMYMSLMFNTNFRGAYTCGNAQQQREAIQLYQRALHRTNGGLLLDLLSAVAPDNSQGITSALNSVGGLLQRVHTPPAAVAYTTPPPSPPLPPSSPSAREAAGGGKQEEEEEGSEWGARGSAALQAELAGLRKKKGRRPAKMLALVRQVIPQPTLLLRDCRASLTGQHGPTTRKSAAKAAAEVKARVKAERAGGASGSGGDGNGDGDGDGEEGTDAVAAAPTVEELRELTASLQQWQRSSYGAVAALFVPAMKRLVRRYPQRLTEIGLDPNLRGRGSSALPLAPVWNSMRRAVQEQQRLLQSLLLRLASALLGATAAELRRKLQRLFVSALVAAEAGSDSGSACTRMEALIKEFVERPYAAAVEAVRKKIRLSADRWYEAMRGAVEAQFVSTLVAARRLRRRGSGGSGGGENGTAAKSVETAACELVNCGRLRSRLAAAGGTLLAARLGTAQNMLLGTRAEARVSLLLSQFLQLLEPPPPQQQQAQQQRRAVGSGGSRDTTGSPRPPSRRTAPLQRLSAALLQVQRALLQWRTEEEERGQEESHAMERRLMARRLLVSAAEGTLGGATQRQLWPALLSVIREVQQRGSTRQHRGSRGGAGALHRHMAAAIAAGVQLQFSPQDLPRAFWAVEDAAVSESVPRSLRLYHSVLAQHFPATAAAATGSAAGSGGGGGGSGGDELCIAQCRLLRSRCTHAVLVLTSGYAPRQQFRTSFPVLPTAAAAAVGDTPSPVTSQPQPQQPQSIAARLVAHLTDASDGGAWAAEQVASQFHTVLEVYVPGGGGIPFRVQPYSSASTPAAAAQEAAVAAVRAAAGAGAALLAAPQQQQGGGGGGTALRCAWSPGRGFAAIRCMPRTPSRSPRGAVRESVRTIPCENKGRSAAAAVREQRQRQRARRQLAQQQQQQATSPAQQRRRQRQRRASSTSRSVNSNAQRVGRSRGRRTTGGASPEAQAQRRSKRRRKK